MGSIQRFEPYHVIPLLYKEKGGMMRSQQSRNLNSNRKKRTANFKQKRYIHEPPIRNSKNPIIHRWGHLYNHGNNTEMQTVV